MTRIIAAALLAAVPAVAAAQAAWQTTDLGGGEAEYRLSNGEGASLLLRCERGVVSAGFEFPGPVNATGRAFLRAIPGERRNVAVKPVGERLLQLTGGGGLDAFLRLLSLSTTANLQVRAGGEQASFTVFGSDLIREAFWGQVSGGATGRPTPRNRRIGHPRGPIRPHPAPESRPPLQTAQNRLYELCRFPGF